MTKYIFVTGGVCSSLGKGIATASVGTLLKSAGFKVFTQKLDPYLNVDPGTMSPFQHGEVFVTDDGAETDLDLGHYERFIDENLSRLSSVTTGKIYTEVLERERRGDFLGGTIQIIPHITNTIQNKIRTAAKESGAEIMLIEIGGTVGDIEGEPFLEAIRQLKRTVGEENVMNIHLTLLPYLKASKELKTKPTQASVRELRRIGITPDIILARADEPIDKKLLEKIALFCDVEKEAVIPARTVKSIYEVPLELAHYRLPALLTKKLKLPERRFNLSPWKKMVEKINITKTTLPIALVGKYTALDDAYLSVIEALKSAGYHHDRKVEIVWVDSEKLEKKSKSEWKKLRSAAGILVPGGFGTRGIEGKIFAARYARENKIPYFGLCLGMQILVIEFARALLNDPQITSEEFDEEQKLPREKYAIHFMPDQNIKRAKGGTLRLGAYECHLQKNTLAQRAYGKEVIFERHRHRYEFNNAFREPLEKHGLNFSGINPQTNLVEISEITDHPFMLGVQFHPEFLSRPMRPHPLFREFVGKCVR
jgi:CTP synthase